MSLPASVCLHGKRGQMNNRRRRALLKQIAGGGGLPPFVDNPAGVELIDYDTLKEEGWTGSGATISPDKAKDYFSYAPIRVNPHETYYVYSNAWWAKVIWCDADKNAVSCDSPQYVTGGGNLVVPDGIYFAIVQKANPEKYGDITPHFHRVEV